MQKVGFDHFNNSASVPSLHEIRVLVVDDSRDCCDFLAMLLQMYGANARIVNSANRVFELFLQFQPQILVIDLALPSVDGFRLLERIRRAEAQRQFYTPAVAITALASEIICQRTDQAGYQALFPKPIDIDAFIATIAYLTQTASTC